MTVTASVNCPSGCGQVEIKPDLFIKGSPTCIPVGGVCPKCKHRLRWNPQDMFLSKFEPEGFTLSELAEAVITIQFRPIE